ncbi:MAG: dienelactone hydrolase family protein [Nitrosospira sp.]
MSAIKGFFEETFTADDRSITLFRKGEGPAVILLHELPGLTHETVEFAEWIAERGFHVVMPLLFGRPLQHPVLGLLKFPILCIRREFNNFAAGKSSPITVLLRALCRKLHAEHGGPGVGAIGMCYTGGFVFAMMVEAALLAPVAAQPSLPLFQSTALDVEQEQLAIASNRTDTMSLLGLRFEQDFRCRAARFERLEASLQSAPGSATQRFLSIVVPGKGHATLTTDYQTALDRGIDTRELVLQHLRMQLLDSNK